MSHLKKEFEEKFIPAVEEMIRKEEEHNALLHSWHNTDPGLIDDCIRRSDNILRHLTNRRDQYKDYAQSL